MIKRYSIKRQIIYNTLAGLLVLVIIIGTLSGFYLIKWLKKEYDENLYAKAKILSSLVKDSENGIEFDFSIQSMPEFQRVNKPEYFQLWVGESNVLQRSGSLGTHTSSLVDLPITDFNSQQQDFQNIELPNGRKGRMVRVGFYPQIPDESKKTKEHIRNLPLVTLAVAKDRESLEKTVENLALSFVAVFLLFATLSALIIWSSVTKGLHPVKKIQQQMALLEADNLSERLKVSNAPDELVEMIDQLNRMTNRLEISFAGEKRFASNVAHGLSTPILELKSLAEIALSNNKDHHFYKDILDSTIQMQATITNLMALARCEKGVVVLEPQVLSLASKINVCWQRFEDLAKSRDISCVNKIDKDLKIISSSAELDIILNNLVSNSISYSVRSSEVIIENSSDESIITLHITNIPATANIENLDKLFDNILNKEPQNNDPTHIGLGLSLIKSYAELLGLEIESHLPENNIITVSLSGLHQDR